MTEVMAEFIEETPVLNGGVWAVRSHHIMQPVRLLGTPFGRQQSDGFRLCGNDREPSLPWFFGNYFDEPFKVAAAMRFFDLAPSDIDKFNFVRAGDSVADGPKNYKASDFAGLEEQVRIAYRVLENAPWQNYLTWNFRKTEKWDTIFKGPEAGAL